jgi:hypothetical protein
MKNTILKYGLISGAFSSVMMVATIPFENEHLGYLVGYTIIVLSFLLVFFGIRSYRDNRGDGQITFARAFAVGIAITLITCVFYVVTWEIIYFNFMHDFMDKYAAHILAKMKAAGATAAAIQAQAQQLAADKQKYENPIYNSAITFLEPFPVGLVMTLLSAVVLRRKSQLQAPASTLTTSA